MSLPKSVKIVEVDDKTVYLIGTAHVSKESVDDVKNVVDQINPDTICVELCESRHKAFKEKDNWKKMDIFKILKEKKVMFLFAQLILSSFYRKLGKQLEVVPGAEMYAGIEEAENRDKELILAERDIQVTLKRVWGGLSFFQKIKFASTLLPSLFFASEEIDDEAIEKLKEEDHLESAMAEFAQEFPGIRSRLIDERDIYLAEKIKSAKGKTVVAVLGAGHLPGIEKNLFISNDLAPITEIPKPSIWPKIIGWSITALIVSLIAYGFIKGGADTGKQSLLIWFAVNGVLSAVGVAIALGHPLTILSALVAAPLTSLNPMIAAGWVAGLVQAYIKKPTVEDLEKIPDATESVKGFWSNAFTRILLVVILANVGSTLGTIIAGSWIAAIVK